MSSVSSPDFWSERYQTQQTGWDEGSPHPFWVKLFQKPSHDYQNKLALVVGAGRGHDAEFLSSFFQRVIAIDFSKTAKMEFEKLYPQSKVDYRVLDFLSPLSLPQIDVVFEHTCLCAIDPQRRDEYFQNLESVLSKDGEYHAILFPKAHPVESDQPPFSTPIAEVEEHLQNINMTVLKKEPIDIGFENRTLKECYLFAKRT